MTATDWAGLAVSFLTIAGGGIASIKFLVKHYLAELKPNGGSSIKDKVNQLETKVDILTDLVKEVIGK